MVNVDQIDILEGLKGQGFVLAPNYIPKTIVYSLEQQLIKAFSSPDVIHVDDDGHCMSTINGDKLLSQSDITGKLYESVFNSLNEVFPRVFELDDKKIAISANCLSLKKDQFRLHFDRNQITVVIYLNNNYNFPLVFYPLVRQDPRIFKNEQHRKIDVENKKPIKVYPQPGLAVIFWGRRTLHGVVYEEATSKPVNGRMSIVFAFDLDKFSYDGEDYYGK